MLNALNFAGLTKHSRISSLLFGFICYSWVMVITDGWKVRNKSIFVSQFVRATDLNECDQKSTALTRRNTKRLDVAKTICNCQAKIHDWGEAEDRKENHDTNIVVKLRMCRALSNNSLFTSLLWTHFPGKETTENTSWRRLHEVFVSINKCHPVFSILILKELNYFTVVEQVHESEVLRKA